MLVTALCALAVGAPPSIDKRLVTGARSERDAAVVIGIESYYTLPTVPYAANDATAVYNTMIYGRGVPTESVFKLDGPNREEMLDALKGASAAVKPGGMLWVYYAGHGMAAPSSGDRLLLGVDAKADEKVIEARAVSVSEIETIAASSGAAQTLVILDTCYGGIGRAGLELLPGKRFAVPTFAKKPSSKVSVWTAAQESQLAGPMKQSPHGAFTYFVVGALRGWADGELGAQDGTITLEEAQTFVARALPSVGLRLQVPTKETRSEVLDWTLLQASTLEDSPDLDAMLEVEKVAGDRLGLLSTQASGLTKATPSEDPIELTLRSYAAPIAKLGSNVYVDQKEKRIHFKDLEKIASQKVAGQLAVARVKRLNVASLASGVVGGISLVPTVACLAGKDFGDTQGSTWCGAVGILGTSYGIAGAWYFQAFAARHKAGVLEQANVVLAEYQVGVPQ